MKEGDKIDEKRKIAERLVGKSVLSRKENSFDFVLVIQTVIIFVAVALFFVNGINRLVSPKNVISKRSSEIQKQMGSYSEINGIHVSVDMGEKINVETEDEKGLWELAREKRVKVQNVNGHYVEIDMRFAIVLIIMAVGGLILSLVGLAMIALIIKEDKKILIKPRVEHDRSHGNGLANMLSKLMSRLGMKRSKQHSRAEVVAEHPSLRYPTESEISGVGRFVLDDSKHCSAKTDAELAEKAEGY